jgi:chaperonin GroEL
MKNKQVILKEDFLDEMYEGAKLLYDVVTTTLGPSGKNVIIENTEGQPVSTKDGVTVAKSIKLQNKSKDVGVQIIKQAAGKTAEIAGDGTTTATALAFKIISHGLQQIKFGSNSTELITGIDKATDDIVAELEKLSTKINNLDQIYDVAYISSNNDPKIGGVIKTAIDAVGHDGLITVEDNYSGEYSVEIIEGMQFDKGYLSPYFITNQNLLQVELNDPYILIYNKKINLLAADKGLMKLLNSVVTANKPILLIADNVEGEALSTLIVNKVKGIMTCCAVKAPEFKTKKIDYMEDIAILTGTQVYSPIKNDNLDKVELSDLGHARLVTINNKSTTIIGGKGNPDEVTARVESIKNQIDTATSDYDKEQLQIRLSKILGSAAVISVGAQTELELKEKKFRIEDALNATKAAIKEGIVPGGGCALKNIKEVLLSKIKSHKFVSSDEESGYKAMLSSLDEPYNKIVINSEGKDVGDYIWKEIQALNKKHKTNIYGFNAKTHKIEDLLASGIIDPTLVTRTAVEKAASVAKIFLTTEAIIVTEIDEEKASNEYMMED